MTDKQKNNRFSGRNQRVPGAKYKTEISRIRTKKKTALEFLLRRRKFQQKSAAKRLRGVKK